MYKDFISIHVPHTRDDWYLDRLIAGLEISIHVPHTRDDELRTAENQRFLRISIHVPHTRDDLEYEHEDYEQMEFQSTSLTRGTTDINLPVAVITIFQSTSLTRGTTSSTAGRKTVWTISIHVPHTRDDTWFRSLPPCELDFNPRPSHEGRRGIDRAGSIAHYFNPRPSHEGRRKRPIADLYNTIFQSTSLTRGTTPPRKISR